ncbi:MAG: hypothetical protein IPK97_04440 [Ahniella sp.]|nr:hypothetical protein [Ahniella sp.]
MKAHFKPFGFLAALCLLLLVAAAPPLQATLGQGGVTGGKSKGGTLRDQPTEAEAEAEAEPAAEEEEEEEEESDDSDETTAPRNMRRKATTAKNPLRKNPLRNMKTKANKLFVDGVVSRH